MTFKFTEEGTINVLHIKPLESLEEKLVNNNVACEVTCQECGATAEVLFNEYETMDEEKRQRAALEEL